jgi:PAS domain S-box-containing protein
MKSIKNESARRLRAQLAKVKGQLAESEATMKAIRSGEVDAIVVDGPKGSRIFTLQSPEEPYRILAERMNEGAATLTPEGTILFCNRRLAEMLEVPAEQLLGSSFIPFLRQQEQVGFTELVREALQDSVRCEGHLVREFSGPLPVQLSLSAIPFEESGQGICLVASDLSDRKRVEEATLRLGAIVNSSDDAIVGKTLEGIVTSWNGGAEKMYGYSAEEMIGQSVSKLIPAGGLDDFKAIIENVKQGKPVRQYDVVRVRKDGEEIHVSLVVSPIMEASGEVIGSSSIAHDISAYKRAEERVRKASRYTRSLIEASLDPLVTISRDGTITDVNESTEKVTGVSRQQLIGSDFSDYFTEPEKARSGYQQVFAQGFVTDYPLAIRHTSGKITDVLYNATVFRNEQGEIEGVFAAARDITARKQAEKARTRAEESLCKLNAELEQRVEERTAELAALNKELEAFNYAVAHDLRAPLRHIHGFAEILADEAAPNLDDAAKRHLETIRDSVQHMSQLLEDLLNLSRLGRQELRKQPCDLNELIGEVMAALKPEAKDREVEWRVAKLPFIEGDPGLTKQVLFNLLSNALKFTRPRHPAIIEIGQTTVEGEAVIFVRDNGVGFDMKYMDKLFGLFQRLHRQQDFEGTGVGLAIVQRIVNRHGGRVWAVSEVEKGATFYVRLNVCGVEKNQPAAAETAVQ